MQSSVTAHNENTTRLARKLYAHRPPGWSWDDVWQEAWIAVGLYSQDRGWVGAVLRGWTAIRDRWRKDARHRALDLKRAVPAAYEPDHALRLDIESALSTLSEQDRAIVVGCLLHDKTSEAVGEEVGLSAGNVRVRLHRLRPRLQELLSEYR